MDRPLLSTLSKNIFSSLFFPPPPGLSCAPPLVFVRPWLVVCLASPCLCRNRVVLPFADGPAVGHGRQQLLLSRGAGQHVRPLRAHPQAVAPPFQPLLGSGEEDAFRQGFPLCRADHPLTQKAPVTDVPLCELLRAAAFCRAGVVEQIPVVLRCCGCRVGGSKGTRWKLSHHHLQQPGEPVNGASSTGSTPFILLRLPLCRRLGITCHMCIWCSPIYVAFA